MGRLITLMTVLLAGTCLAQHDHHAGMQAGEALADRSVYQLAGSWTDQDGKPRELSGFRGRPVVLTMVYTHCATACPLLAHDLQRIDHALDADASDRVQKILVSIDPQRDTPERLAEFARSRGLDRSDWTLLRGERGTVRRLATLLGVRYRRHDDGSYSHSNLIVVLDRDGIIQHREQGLRRPVEDSVAALRAALAFTEN